MGGTHPVNDRSLYPEKVTLEEVPKVAVRADVLTEHPTVLRPLSLTPRSTDPGRRDPGGRSN